MYYVLLVVGFILLIKGADYFVEGSSNLAKYLKVPSFIIGLTIVSVGTSAPETVVSTIASIKNANDMAISNVIGSNMFNLLIVLGMTSLIKPLTFNKELKTRDFVVMIISSIILLIFMCDKYLNLFSLNVITRGESLILLLIFSMYIYVILLYSKNKRYKRHQDYKLKTVDILMLFSGVLAIILGGELVVRSAKIIAISWGISEILVGLTIVSIGTSLPELVTSVVAAIKKETSIAIGNAIGSNIYNTLFVIGISGLVSEIFVKKEAIIDMSISILIYIFIFALILKTSKIRRKTGIIMLISYFLFILFVVNM